MFDLEIYRQQRLENIERPREFGIYVHIPFCVRRCRYCAFVSSVWRCVPSRDYAEKIIRELEARREPYDAMRLKTVYFGGGTPTMIDDDALDRITSDIMAHFGQPDEMTIEANPEHVTLERAHRWKSAGFTRISLGVQSFDDAMIAMLGRRHNAAQVMRAVQNLDEAGFDEISIDLIYGGCTREVCDRDRELARWRSELERAKSIHPAHVSCYELTVEPNTPIWTSQKRGQRVLCDEETLVAMMSIIQETLGMAQYEISNYSRVGYFSAHNLSCWGGVPYLGVGPGAHSFYRCGENFVREAVQSHVRAWLQDPNDAPQLEFRETLPAQTHFEERLMCAARTRWWWNPREIATRIDASMDAQVPMLEKAVERGLLERKDECFRTTEAGIRLNNQLDALIFDA